ncbi:hypothetical protein FUAX_55500 (plasmid) [Fulvitalea axinellae]|uniref:Restriction endonuclease n=1 Tax=Fulvitalea axinellae TaxID=1182444 RepID=A0AAU9DB45_9BACT|nr:hypothetical protein FUAX_55500 [Fulvitalea axinellae]
MKHKLISCREHTGASEKKPRLVSAEGMREERYVQRFPKTHKGKSKEQECFRFDKKANDEYQLTTGYFVGADWIIEGERALYVEPKLNVEGRQLDHLGMLFSCLKHAEVREEIKELSIVKWDRPSIRISQEKDMLTPFLVVEFLAVLKDIVRKGLKKSYYPVERNLYGRVKGKVLVGKTVKHNLSQQKRLHVYCSHEAFGFDHKENRLLKKALVFVQRYLPTFHRFADHKELNNTLHYIMPAFAEVSEEIGPHEIKHSKFNAFYKEYGQALDLAKMILKRFGYNLNNTVEAMVNTPPFWIDMSKLFELYALGLLKDRFGNQVKFQVRKKGNELDYLLDAPHDDKRLEYKMVVDAKYKEKYVKGRIHKDMRQVSGYARLREVHKDLNIPRGEVIDCLIIYPDQENGVADLFDVNLKATEIDGYYNIFKVGVRLPMLER